MAKIFITGATGFVGHNLSVLLKQLGHDVYGTGRSSDRASNIVNCDITIAEHIRSVIIDVDPDIIIHAAALSSVTDGKTMDYYHSNVLGTEHVLKAIDALDGRRRVIYISTAGVYGNQGVAVLDESLCPKPVSHYGISKFAGECLLKGEFSDRHDVTIVRPFNIVGPGQKSGFIFPKIVQHFREKKEVIRLGNLDPVRDYLDISSCCNYIAQIIFNSAAFGETVNLCSGRGTSVRQLVDGLRNITGHDIKVEVAQEFVRKNEVWSLLGNTHKLKSLCHGAVKLLEIEEVLRRMYQI